MVLPSFYMPLLAAPAVRRTQGVLWACQCTAKCVTLFEAQDGGGVLVSAGNVAFQSSFTSKVGASYAGVLLSSIWHSQMASE